MGLSMTGNDNATVLTKKEHIDLQFITATMEDIKVQFSIGATPTDKGGTKW